MKKTYTRFDALDMKQFEPEAKVGLIATVNPEGLPHVTLITALQAKTPEKLIWGQFSEGRSKEHVKTNPKTGFAIMTMDKSLWRGKALYTHRADSGDDYEMFNLKPMFRYNAYFGIHTVHYMDLLETYGKESLPLARIGLGSVLALAGRSAVKPGHGKRILKPWAEALFKRLDTIKFISHCGGGRIPGDHPAHRLPGGRQHQARLFTAGLRRGAQGDKAGGNRCRIRPYHGDGGRAGQGDLQRV